MAKTKNILKEASLNLKNMENPRRETVFLKGIPASPGIVIANAVRLEPESLIAQEVALSKSLIPAETVRFEQAMGELAKEFTEVLEKVREEATSAAAIIETNLALISDPFLQSSILKRIASGASVEYAVTQEFDSQMLYLKNSRDGILRQRYIELDHIKQQILLILRNRCIYYHSAKNAILIANSLTILFIFIFLKSLLIVT